MTNVPAVQWTPNGLVIPSEQEVLQGVLADLDQAFGGGMNPGLTTPQGQLATSETAIIGNNNSELIALINAVDPAYAYGRMQDALCRIYFLERRPATPSRAACLCVGAASTIIPVGALVTDGVNTWVCSEGGVIGPGGSVTLNFDCSVTGPVPAVAGAINKIYRTIPGWDTVTNPSDAILGTVVETRSELEQRRNQTLMANSIGTVQAMLGAILKIDGVTDAYIYSNDTSGNETVSGITIGAHQVYCAVSGGDSLDVATALWKKKPPGSPWFNGNTTVTVYDSEGYEPPYPAYTVKFEDPAALPILFEVTIAASNQVPATYQSLIQAAIIAAFAGADGGPRARIGSTIYASRFYAPVAALGPWAQIISIKIGTSVANADDLTVPINRVPTVAPSDITVVAS